MTKILAAAICVGWVAISGMAQSTLTMRIPFAFYVGGTKLPAGSYEIETVKPQVLRITNTSARNIAVAFNPLSITRSGKGDQSGGYVFYRHGGNYFLSEIWTAGNSTGLLVPGSDFQSDPSRNGPSIRIESLSFARQ